MPSLLPASMGNVRLPPRGKPFINKTATTANKTPPKPPLTKPNPCLLLPARPRYKTASTHGLTPSARRIPILFTALDTNKALCLSRYVPSPAQFCCRSLPRLHQRSCKRERKRKKKKKKSTLAAAELFTSRETRALAASWLGKPSSRCPNGMGCSNAAKQPVKPPRAPRPQPGHISRHFPLPQQTTKMEVNRELQQKRSAPGRAAPPGSRREAGGRSVLPPLLRLLRTKEAARHPPAEPLGHNTYLPTVEPQGRVVGTQQGR